MAELLTFVRKVCDSHQHVNALTHVAHTIDAFLWVGTSHGSMERASKHGLIHLLDRLLKLEWPGFNRQCRELRLRNAIKDAMECGYAMQVMLWWIRRYMPDQKDFAIEVAYNLAIYHRHFPMLEWIFQETKGKLPRYTYCAYSHSPDTLAWRLDHGDLSPTSRLSMSTIYRSDAISFQSIKRCFIHQDEDSSFQISHAEKAVNEVLAFGRPEDLQWLYEHRRALFEPNLLRNAVRFGNLEAAKWLVSTFPQHYFNNPRQTFDNFCADILPYRYNLDMVKWVLCEFVWRNERNQSDWMSDASDYAARSGRLEMLEFVYKMQMEKLKTPDEASQARRKWAKLLMDKAAAIGQLDILQFLQDHQSRICTTEAMKNAAAKGHLNVVQWLHHNRSEGCTSDAMDYAAAGGHLELVKWLHENRSEGCTTPAMDLAAKNGHLKVVQWLHENRSEGCTTNAMDSAAKNGHLDVIQFLQTNRTEGCTPNAILQAASCGQYNTFKWLYENRPERLPPDSDILSGNRHILKCRALYTKHNGLVWFLNKFLDIGDFETIEMLLSKHKMIAIHFSDVGKFKFTV